jgi:hypothetical protein
MEQIIEYYTQIAAFGMRVANLTQMAKEGHFTNEMSDTLSLLSPSGR